MNNQTGVPGAISLDFAKEWALARVSKKRADHVAGVEQVGLKLAQAAGLSEGDQFIVQLACLLHDCCKEYKDTDLVAAAEAGGLGPNAVEQVNGHLLHGPVAALVVKNELAVTNQSVLDAISEHTLGNRPMSDISKIVFLADCLEESRPRDYTDPIWQALENTPINAEQAEKAEQAKQAKKIIGGDKDIQKHKHKKNKHGDDKKKVAETYPARLDWPANQDKNINLDNAMLVALDLGLAQLLQSRRAIHPKSVDVRNYFLGIVKAAEKSRSAQNPSL